jgi:hypothetical protein
MIPPDDAEGELTRPANDPLYAVLITTVASIKGHGKYLRKNIDNEAPARSVVCVVCAVLQSKLETGELVAVYRLTRES